MNMQSQKRVIQINHGLSGVYGEEIKHFACHLNEARKQILKKLQRKKKLSSIIHDQLYSYLQKFPQEKLGLQHQSCKKKRARLAEFQDKANFQTPWKETIHQQYLTTNHFADKYQSFIQYRIKNQSSEDNNLNHNDTNHLESNK